MSLFFPLAIFVFYFVVIAVHNWDLIFKEILDFHVLKTLKTVGYFKSLSVFYIAVLT